MPDLYDTRQVERLTRILAAVLAGLTVLLLILTIVFFATKPSDKSPEETTPGTNTPIEPTDKVTLPQTPDAGMAYQDSLIFVGDSLTAHLRSTGALTGGTNTKQVWRHELNTMTLSSEINAVKIIYPETGEKMTISQAAAKAKPSILVINLGINGVSFLKESDFKDAYASLIRAVREASPNTRIILQSIYPVTDFCSTKGIDNARIDTANQWVKAVAAENGCRYLDVQSVLKDSKNNLNAEYCNNPDGIHMGKNGYEVVLEYIRTHALTD